MDRKKIIGVLSILSVVFAIMILLVGTVSADDQTAPAVSGTGTAAKENRHAGHTWNSTIVQQQLQIAITRLGQQGVDISQAQADLTGGNTTAAMQWLHSYRAAHPAPKTNTTQQQQRLLAFVSHAEQTGIDVSQLKMAIQNNDTAGVKAWLTSYGETHKNSFPNSTRQQGVQAFTSHVPKSGTNATHIKTTVHTNSTTAMKSWGTGQFHKSTVHTNSTTPKGVSL